MVMCASVASSGEFTNMTVMEESLISAAEVVTGANDSAIAVDLTAERVCMGIW